MNRALRLIALAIVPALTTGCQNLRPAIDPPPLFSGGPVAPQANPVYVPLPKQEYGRVCETILEVLHDYDFEIADSNRYSGHVEAVPRTAPGLLNFFKPGNPGCYDRLLCTFQSYRHRVTVIVQPADPQGAEHGGYFVEFIARKELEDLARPIRSTVGGAVFRAENTVDRQTEVIDADIYDARWIYRGRDTALEQELIWRYHCALSRRP
jgi:hypothetical protein